MPKARKSPAAAVLEFFQTSPIDQAQLVLDLARDAVRRRSPEAARKVGRPRKKVEAIAQTQTQAPTSTQGAA